ncbi:MAG: N-acetyltransferase [Bacteroidales bacterium]|jgi:GNAT superfamily N-acetyltransferase|nr:N-acetyltransferase [Bacteroidales bacterium]
MSVTIKTVSSVKDFKTFARFANRLYKGNKYYVPSMPMDDLSTFSKEKNAAFEFSDAEFYLAYKDGEVVGRVAAIINHKANEAWKVKQVRFGWIDFIDDMEVSAALLDAVIEFGRKAGMTQIVGPLGFTDFDPEGMLVDGYDRLGTMALIYNHPYYPEHMKKHGYYKETGWLEYRITIPETVSERHKQIAEAVMERYGLTIKKKTRRQIKKERYGQKLFKLINETYCVLYGYSLLSEKQIDQYVGLYLSLIDTEMLTFVENAEGELIAAGISIPSLSEALQKCNGEIFPFGWWHLLKAMFLKKPDTLDLLLIGVRPDYQNKGINSIMILDLVARYNRLGFRYAETNAMLETNAKIHAMFEPFEKEVHKRRWVFGKDI